MKMEYGAFTASSSVLLVTLNDWTLTPSRILFWIESPHTSHGYDDGVRQVCQYRSSSIKNDRSIYLHNGTTALMSGRITLFDVGEFEITFDVRTSDQIKFLAIED